MLTGESVEVWEVTRGAVTSIRLRAVCSGVPAALKLAGLLTGRFELWTEAGVGVCALHADGSGVGRCEPIPEDEDDEVATAIRMESACA